jgi:hypothetical protein
LIGQGAAHKKNKVEPDREFGDSVYSDNVAMSASGSAPAESETRKSNASSKPE